MKVSRTARKFFLCTGQCVRADQLGDYPQSHIIGELRYVFDEGQKMTALAIYEVSFASSIVPPIDVRIRVEIIGDARRIKCTYRDCVHFKRWEIGRAAALQLLQRYEKSNAIMQIQN